MAAKPTLPAFGLGDEQAFRPGRTAASMSGMASRSGRLMRTATSAPPRTTFFMVSGSTARASAFHAGGTLSSRSTNAQSAPRSCALSMNFGTLPGM